MYVELKNINKMYNDYKASNDINLGIKKGKLVALLGPSGSGKSTILRMIAGLETPDSGEIVIDGKVVNDVSPSKRGIGFVFQNYALFRYMTVFDNIAFGLKIAKERKSVIKERVEKLMELVNIKGLGKRYPNQLSGGQRQRVALQGHWLRILKYCYSMNLLRQLMRKLGKILGIGCVKRLIKWELQAFL